MRKLDPRAVAAVTAGLYAAAFAYAAAKPLGYHLPDERPVSLPPGDGAELTQNTCSACHSLDYIQTQPRGLGPQVWRAEVAKMVTSYGAAIEPGDADKITAYLAKTFG
jgi:mono/diheme cytochrome c family protein